MSQIQISILSFTLLFLLASSKMYNLNMTCGTCQNKTGCTGNICFFLTGDLTGQYCYGASSCASKTQLSFQLGSCSYDYMGYSCSSGMCMNGMAGSACFSSTSGCPSGYSFTETCSNRAVNFSMTIPGQPNSATSTFNLTTDCYFSSGTGNYSSCSGDIYGGSCNCCLTMTLSGIKDGSGSCVPQNSSFVAVKLGADLMAWACGAMLFILLLAQF